MKHGLTKGGKWHPLYRVFSNLKARCHSKTATHYEYYGGRGIAVCDEWRQNPPAFVKWAEANGWQPGLEVDRIDSDGDYSPGNCRITTHRENSQRTRRIKTTPAQARKVRSEMSKGVSIKEAAAAAGVTYMVAWHIKNSPGVWNNI